MAERSMAPLIPGMLSTYYQTHHNRTHFRKGQLLEQMSYGKLKAPDPVTPTTSFTHQNISRVANVSRDVKPPPPPTRPAQGSTKFRVDATLPSWITNDRQVMRYFGYFQEKVQSDDGADSVRTRRVVLCFYLSDKAISISEPRVANSGMVQGEFMKRTVVMKPNGSHYSPLDFRIGNKVKLYGRIFHIVDCDETTRTYHAEALDDVVDDPHRYPDDFSSQVDEIEAIKTKLRAKATFIQHSKTENMRKFHENSQKVLRFYLSWQDPHPFYPETRRYILHYYLCDDTMEIVEPKEERDGRSGRGHFAVLLSRRKMVSDDTNNHRQQGGSASPKDNFITERDLRCGEWLHVYSRKFFIEDCDPFTRDYYLETHGVTQEKFEPPGMSQQEKPSKWKLFQAKSTPTVTSLADMVQRLGSHRQENQATKNSATTATFYQKDALDKKQLRFRARFIGYKPSDVNFHREFVLTYFLEDDTLSVFEPRIRNSGVTGGRFLDRGRFRKCHSLTDGGTHARENQKERSFYRASDFYVGAVVSFEFSPHQRLELIEADRQTLSYCESHPDEFPFSNIINVLEGLAVLLAKERVDLRSECRKLDDHGSGMISAENLKSVLQTANVFTRLNAQQTITIYRKFSEQESPETMGSDKPFIYDDFCDELAFYMSTFAPTKQAAKGVCGKLRKITNLRKLARNMDCNGEGVITIDDFLRITSFHRVALSESEIKELLSNYCRQHKIVYPRLCDQVFQLSTGSIHLGSNPLTTIAPAAADHDEIERNYSAHGDEAVLRPLSPRKTFYTSPSTPHISNTAAARLQSNSMLDRSAEKTADARVVELLQRLFGSRKYQLRKALRERDHEKTGLLAEEEFMDAILSLEPSLSDDESYLIADVYFPSNNCQIDYSKLLESAFRT